MNHGARISEASKRSMWDVLSPYARKMNPHLAPPDAKILAQQFDDAADRVGEAKTEKQLQNQLYSLLYRRGHRPRMQRMDRKSNIAIGMPDISFEIGGKSCHWEVKMPGKNPEPEQVKMMAELEAVPNCAHVRVIRTYREGLDDLNALQKHLRECSAGGGL